MTDLSTQPLRGRLGERPAAARRRLTTRGRPFQSLYGAPHLAREVELDPAHSVGTIGAGSGRLWRMCVRWHLVTVIAGSALLWASEFAPPRSSAVVVTA